MMNFELSEKTRESMLRVTGHSYEEVLTTPLARLKATPASSKNRLRVAARRVTPPRGSVYLVQDRVLTLKKVVHGLRKIK
jgi:hypothetical protein